MRLDELFAFPAERTAFSDEVYAALGRAVTFCSLFEHNCSAIAAILKLRVRHRGSTTPDVVEQVSREMEKRPLADHLNAVWKTLDLPREARDVFDAGRVARNSIVHDVAVGIERDVESDAGRQRIVAELRDEIDRVARADLLACGLSQQLTGEELPPPRFASCYPSRIVSWVCEVENEL
jgi:hypothetical protein